MKEMGVNYFVFQLMNCSNDERRYKNRNNNVHLKKTYFSGQNVFIVECGMKKIQRIVVEQLFVIFGYLLQIQKTIHE